MATVKELLTPEGLAKSLLALEEIHENMLMEERLRKLEYYKHLRQSRRLAKKYRQYLECAKTHVMTCPECLVLMDYIENAFKCPSCGMVNDLRPQEHINYSDEFLYAMLWNASIPYAHGAWMDAICKAGKE